MNLAKIMDVQFGPAGWVRLVGKDISDNDISVDISMTELSKTLPRLVHAAEVFLEAGPLPPATGTSVPPWIAHARAPHAFEGKDNREPCLSFHTHAGSFHIHFAPSDTITCGRNLQTIRTAASQPESKKMN